jgi:hypothetical protein
MLKKVALTSAEINDISSRRVRGNYVPLMMVQSTG